MKRIHILTEEHYTSKGELRIGGLHNYVHNLAGVFVSNEYEVYIHETSFDGIPFSFFHNGISINGYRIEGNFRQRCLALQKRLCSFDRYEKGDLVIWATDYMAQYNKLPNAIALQHGIAWDVPKSGKSFKKWLRLLFMVKQKLKILGKIDGLVAVDYNYWNWVRANYSAEDLYSKIQIIPNFVGADFDNPAPEKSGFPLKICFARRFEDYRGTSIMIEAIRLLSKEDFFSSVSFVFAGDGPLKQTILDSLPYPNVSVTKYAPKDAVEFHKQFAIAVIPTIGSEGTSLSALEAMAAGCAIISTPVGGLSNIVIDDYTGLIVKPNPIELACAIKRLCTNEELRKRLSQYAFQEAKDGFSLQKWKMRWLTYLKNDLKY